MPKTAFFEPEGFFGVEFFLALFRFEFLHKKEPIDLAQVCKHGLVQKSMGSKILCIIFRLGTVSFLLGAKGATFEAFHNAKGAEWRLCYYIMEWVSQYACFFAMRELRRPKNLIYQSLLFNSSAILQCPVQCPSNIWVISAVKIPRISFLKPRVEISLSDVAPSRQ